MSSILNETQDPAEESGNRGPEMRKEGAHHGWQEGQDTGRAGRRQTKNESYGNNMLDYTGTVRGSGVKKPVSFSLKFPT
jgi:hypothetical protein